MGDVENLAAFVLARSHDPEVGEADRIRCEGVLAAFDTHMAQPETETLMRGIAARFADHPDYRYEWRPGLQQREEKWSGFGESSLGRRAGSQAMSVRHCAGDG